MKATFFGDGVQPRTPGPRNHAGSSRTVTGAGWRLAFCCGAVFAGPGVTPPFLPAFLARRGLGAAGLAAMLVARAIARLVSAPLAGRAADASGRRTRAAALAALAGGVAVRHAGPEVAPWAMARGVAAAAAASRSGEG